VGVIPDGLTRGVYHSEADFGQWGINRPGTWVYGYEWFAADDSSPYLSVVVTCGELARDLEYFHRYTHRHDGHDEPQLYPEVNGSPTTTTRSADGGRAVFWQPHPGIVLEVAVGQGFVAALDEIIAGIELRLPDDAVDDTTDVAAAAGCPLPELRPGMLPWLADGEPVPDPVEVRFGTPDEPDSVMTWAAEPDPEELWDVAHLSIGRIHTPDNEPGDQHFAMVDVRGHEAELVWVGDPGMGQLRVNWREQPGPCGVYSVWLGTYDAWWLDTPVVDGQPCEEYSEECAAEFQRLLEVAIIEVADALE
jgi:hypothetical protein